MNWSWPVVMSLVLGAVVVGHDVACAAGALGDAERGQTLFAAAAGCGCHTPENGPVGAGGRGVETPFGTFYSTNITPDPDTGIGDWSDAEIDDAIRRGIIRGRGIEAPVMPYYRYAGLANRDVADLVAYLRTLPPVRLANREHEVRVPFLRWGFRVWRLLYGRSVSGAAEAPRGGIERGRYLTEHAAICGDCHTARNLFGAPIRALYLAGTPDGPGDEPVPNITPDVASGIGEWTASDIVTLLELGVKPNFDNVQGAMAEVIEGHGGGPGYAGMRSVDREAIAAYLKSVPAVANTIGAE